MQVAPCCGCGYCCQKGICSIGAAKCSLPTFPIRDEADCCPPTQNKQPQPACPFLIWNEEDCRYWCKIILDANEPEKAELIRMMAIGAGCSSSLFNTQREDLLRRQKEAKT